MNVTARILFGVTVLELIALISLARSLVVSRRHNAELQARLDHRGGPRTAAGRAMKAVVGTAVRLRDQGVGGMLASSLEDLTRWAGENREEIARVAAPDGTVTILFSDIEDSTLLTERLGDAGWMRLLDAHDRLVRDQVSGHDGHVVKTQGDGFMVVFREPIDAVRAAIGIQSDLRSGGGRRLRRTPIRVRIGIHVGPVVSRDGDYFGRNVALCARIAAHAAGEETLASSDVAAALVDVD
ncbi:MAG: adenylate/guanylate cyclase domain-containing protein, partial [Actinomycetota bacterium]|nr:adenylate/guanylate cyclase domain-containing protein [Actinomycetota bacterium]